MIATFQKTRVCRSLLGYSSNFYCPGCVELQAIFLVGPGYSETKQLDCFVGASCSWSSKTITFARPPCGQTYFIGVDNTLDYCNSFSPTKFRTQAREYAHAYTTSSVALTSYLADVPAFLQVEIPCLPPSPPPSPSLSPSFFAGPTVFGHLVIQTVSELFGALANAPTSGVLSLFLPADTILELNGSPVTVTNVELRLRSDGVGAVVDAKRLSRAFEVHDGTLHLTHIHIINGQASYGGGIAVTMDSKLFMEQSSIRECAAIAPSSTAGSYIISPASGAALSVLMRSSATLLHSTIEDTTATGDQSVHGGAVHVDSSSLSLTGSHIINASCTAEYVFGCAIYVNSAQAAQGRVWLSNSSISGVRLRGNVAGNGGAIAGKAAVITAERASMLDNEVSSQSRAQGGSVFLSRGSVGTFKESMFRSSRAVLPSVWTGRFGTGHASGGAAWVSSDSELSLDDYTSIAECSSFDKVRLLCRPWHAHTPTNMHISLTRVSRALRGARCTWRASRSSQTTP